MRHFTTPEFWAHHANLPEAIKKAADKSYRLLESNPKHRSLNFKCVGRYWSVRASIGYRALAVKDGDDFIWFWIGHHSEYDRLIR